MTAIVMRLHWARMTSPGEAAARACWPSDWATADTDDMRWSEIALVVRNRLQLPRGIGEDTIIESLKEIASVPDADERWAAAFGSTLGLYLSLGVDGFEEAMDELLSILPPIAA
ncbi:MAG: hypothetical protein AAGC70_12665 [Pseudomonadota bacterium]